MTTHTEPDRTAGVPSAPVGQAVRSRVLPGIAWGALVFLVVVLAGGTFVATRPTEWSAEATAMVVPEPGLDPAATAGYYETLSRGQVIATIAQILQLQRLQVAAADRVGLTPTQRQETTVEIQVVPNTTILQITTTARSAAVAERMADGILTEASSYAGLPDPYVLSVLGRADGTASRLQPPRLAFAGVVLLVALVAGLATQQAVYHLGVALGHRGGPGRPARPSPPREPVSGEPGRGGGGPS